MKILIVPDVHGRDFWVEPCSHVEEYDKIVFLGDYHDPYPFQVSKKTSRHRLETLLVPFVEEHRSKVVCLFGNHDGNYLVGDMADRVDGFNRVDISKLLKRLDLQLIYEVPGYLFSHSGVLPTWLSSNNLTKESLNDLKFDNPALLQVSPMRGGYDRCGSCVWGDVREYINLEHIPNVYQIFGHTQLEDAVILNDFACLDCRKCFILDTDTGEIKEY